MDNLVIMNNEEDKGRKVDNYRTTSSSRKHAKGWAIIKRVVILAIILAVTLTVSTILLKSQITPQNLIYIQTIEIAVIGYFVVETLSSITYKLTVSDNSQETAKSIRSLMRIAGTIIIVAIIISYLAQNPVVAASFSAISALVVGFASQNILGNMIAGLYLSLIRPVKIGDRIRVSGNTGVIYDIELIYTRLLTENGDIVLVPSASMVTGIVILEKGKRDDDRGGNIQ
jgi:small-conductance mechanosensitive channel